MQMAAGESGTPGNGGNGVSHSKGTAKKLREASAAKLPLPFEEGQRARGGCRDDEGCPRGCQRAAGWAQSRWHSQAGREPVQAGNRELLPGSKRRASAQGAAHCSAPRGHLPGRGNLEDTFQPPV